MATLAFRRWYWIPSVLLYLISLTLPAVYQAGFGAPTSGLQGAVIPGYLMVGKLPFAMLSPCWWANPLWLIGVIAALRQKSKWAIGFSIGATTLALLTLVIGPFPPDMFQYSHFHAGYFVWLSAMATLLLMSTLDVMFSPGRTKN